MKKIVKKRRKKRIEKKYTSHIKFYVSFIILSALFSSCFTFLVFYSKIKSESVLADSLQTIPNYPENNKLSENNPEVIYHGSRSEKKIALTFDADMTPWMKEQILGKNVPPSINKQLLNYLEQTQTKATLFLTGLWIELYPEETKALATNPLFELENHSYSHPSFSGYCFGLPQIPPGSEIAEIGTTQTLLNNITKQENKFFRFPGGCFNQNDLDLVKQAGLQIIHWDVEGEDGFNFNIANIENNILDNVKNGSIIVLHMNGYPTAPRTAEAVENIVPELKKRGYKFVKISELLEK